MYKEEVRGLYKREKNIEKGRPMNKQRETEKHVDGLRRTDKQTDREKLIDRQIDKEVNGKTDRQTYKHRKTWIEKQK